MPVLTAPHRGSRPERSGSAGARTKGSRETTPVTPVVFCAVSAARRTCLKRQRREGLEVGLDAGAASRIGAGDGQAPTAALGRAPGHHSRRGPGYLRPVRAGMDVDTPDDVRAPEPTTACASEVPAPADPGCSSGPGGMTSLRRAPRSRAAWPRVPAVATVAVRRVEVAGRGTLLSPAAGSAVCASCPTRRDVRLPAEAVLTAKLAREALETDWVKLEVIGDERTLLPDAVELLLRPRSSPRRLRRAAVHHRRPRAGLRLQQVGCAAVMPLGSPIGAGSASGTRTTSPCSARRSTCQ